MTTPTITVRILGGLGNQLFAYAAARRLAVKNDCDLVIDHVSGFRFDKKYKRTYQLDHFQIPCRKANPSEMMEPFSRVRRYIRKKTNQNKDFFHRDYIQQEVFDFDDRLIDFKPNKNICIEGYWQSENYFKDIEALIRQDLVISSPQDVRNQELVRQITEHKNPVAVHYRYFNEDQSSSDNLSLDYYRQAFERISTMVENPHFFVFSDHPEKVLQASRLPEEHVTIVSHNRGEDMAFADLWLMQQCRHFIIANSTFSWWGAWLGSQKDKTIIAPKLVKRFGDSWWGFSGLLPETWILV